MPIEYYAVWFNNSNFQYFYNPNLIIRVDCININQNTLTFFFSYSRFFIIFPSTLGNTFIYFILINYIISSLNFFQDITIHTKYLKFLERLYSFLEKFI